MFSIKGDTVLDPFLGSGTTTKIALQNERNSIGYETDPELLPIISKRIGGIKEASELQIIKR
jgi:DNA modification methylase